MLREVTAHGSTNRVERPLRSQREPQRSARRAHHVERQRHRHLAKASLLHGLREIAGREVEWRVLSLRVGPWRWRPPDAAAGGL